MLNLENSKIFVELCSSCSHPRWITVIQAKLSRKSHPVTACLDFLRLKEIKVHWTLIAFWNSYVLFYFQYDIYGISLQKVFGSFKELLKFY